MHKQVLQKNETRAQKATAATANAEACNVCEGDYVLWSRVDENHHPKLLVTWLGPYRVTEVGEYSVEIEHLLTKERRQAHLSRIKLYAEESFQIDRDAGEYALLVRWEGLEDIEASWELLSKLMRECPAVVRAYAKSIKQKKAREDLEAAMAK
ncbi:hypothetical protein Ae201684P_014890 [Aphanomyces euteiches]|nr:hypothetical protein Ae201684P_014890 [Aphanomyces euteiches]